MTEVPPAPAKRRINRGILALILILATVTVIVALIVTYLLVSSQRTPEAAATAFLDGLVEGDASAALALMTDLPTGNPVMLDPDAYAGATDLISSFTVLGSEVDGADAVVTVDIQQGGERYEQQLTLSLVRRDLGVLDVWRVDGDNLANVYVSFTRPDDMDLAVSAVDFGVLSGSYEFNAPALPGTWQFTPEGTSLYYAAEPVSVTTRFAGTKATAAIPVALTEAGIASATAAVNAHLDACTAQASFAPGPGCGFGLESDGAYTNEVLSNIVWTTAARPTFTFGNYRKNVGWVLLPGTAGALTATADFTADEGDGTAEGSVPDLVQRGTITSIDDNGVAIFVSDYE